LAFYADNWFHALAGGPTSRTMLRAQDLVVHVDDQAAAARVARRLLADHRGTRLLVAPQHARSLRARLAPAGLADRVVTWHDRSAGEVSK
jgi:hypothetical protein